MNNPVPLGSESSSGTLEAERQLLMGTWELVDLLSAPEKGGPACPGESHRHPHLRSVPAT